MATNSQIKVVRELLGPVAAAEGWDDARINSDLDAGLTANDIAAAWWSFRAASTASLVDVSESGSSRSLSGIHRAAVTLATAFQRAASEDSQGDPQDKPRGFRSRPVNRV